MPDNLFMRTTVTLDPDVERLLRKAIHERGQSFKETLNQALRHGLADVGADIDEPPFRVSARPMRLRPGIDPARLHAHADELEMDAHAELSHRLRKETASRDRS